MKRASNILLLFFLGMLLFLTACEEDIDLELTEGARKIVIEGAIENDKYAEVIISKNSPLSNVVDVSSIMITNAKVFISDGILIDTLQLDTLWTASIPLVYVGKKIKGIAGKRYNLTVVWDDKIYSASTLIPNPIPLDSVWWAATPPYADKGVATARLSEPKGYGNAYRWYAKLPTRIIQNNNGIPVILNRRYMAPQRATFDDKFIDGKTMEFSFYKGKDPTETFYADTVKWEDLSMYKKTDTIYIKFCSIDDQTAYFYQTMESAIESNGNPFASPSSIMGNISGGALGIWAGFGVSLDTIMPH